MERKSVDFYGSVALTGYHGFGKNYAHKVYVIDLLSN